MLCMVCGDSQMCIRDRLLRVTAGRSGEEALKAEVEQLKQAVAAQNAQPGYEEQVALLEKSYELAARYMPALIRRYIRDETSFYYIWSDNYIFSFVCNIPSCASCNR